MLSQTHGKSNRGITHVSIEDLRILKELEIPEIKAHPSMRIFKLVTEFNIIRVSYTEDRMFLDIFYKLDEINVTIRGYTLQGLERIITKACSTNPKIANIINV